METIVSNKLVLDSQIAFMYSCFDEGASVVLNENSNVIIFVVAGRISLYDSSITTEIDNHSMALLPIGGTYQIKVMGSAKLLFYSFRNSNLLDISININMFNSSSRRNRESVISLPYDTILQCFIDLICKIKEGSVDHLKNYDLSKIKQQELFMLLNMLYSKEDMAQFFEPILNKQIEFEEKVLLHYKEAKTAQILAELCGYGYRDFSRKFVVCFGISPYQWMINHTARDVRKLLKSNKTFKDIMYECQFSSQAHLTKFCKQYLGGTPSSIRNEE